MKAYKLLKDIPGLRAGSVFVHDHLNRTELGNPAHGALILAWNDGGCGGVDDMLWCGDSFIMPGQMRNDSAWFAQVPNPVSKKDATRQQYYLALPLKPEPEPKPAKKRKGWGKALLKRRVKALGADGPVASMLGNAPASHKDVLLIRDILRELVALVPDDDTIS